MPHSLRTPWRVNTVLTAIVALFVVVFAAFAAAAVSTALENQRIIGELGRGNIDRSSDLNAATSEIFQARALLTEAKTNMEGGMIEQRDAALVRVDAKLKAAETHIARFRANPDTDTNGAAHYAEVLKAYEGFVKTGLQPLAAALKGWNGIEANRVSDQVLPKLADSFVNSTDLYQQAQRERGEQSVARADDLLNASVWVAWGVFAFFCVLAIGMRLVVGRVVLNPLKTAGTQFDRMADGNLADTIAPRGRNEIGVLFAAMRRMQQGLSRTVLSIRSNVEQMNAGVSEIAAAGNDMSDRTAQQAAALQETTANMSALDSTVQRSAVRAQEAERGARAATELARAAGDAVGRAESRMTEMSREADRISAIVNVVESIAFQTNILALNAAVEAARAGQEGRGFAVVAGEVRNLAQRSAEAAKEIKSLIDDTNACAAAGVQETADAARITREAAQVSPARPLKRSRA